MKKLFIVESPGKVKTISKYLGDDFIVAASVGHIRDLPKNDLGVDLKSYEPEYILTDTGKKTVKKLKEQLKKCDEVYLALDADREGEAIAWHLKEVLNLKNPKRIYFTEITEVAIKEALKEPKLIDVNLVSAQECRRVIDRMIGYMVSPAIGKILGTKKASAGRVQTPSLILLDRREKEIADFKAKNYYTVEVDLGGWKAQLDVKSILSESSEHLFSNDIANKISSIKEFSVILSEKKTRSQNAPSPFDTVALQKAASAQLKLSPTETMAVAQKLYEKGLITYMRTDSLNLSVTAYEQVNDYMNKEGLPNNGKMKKWKNTGDAQEAHECIRPTDINEKNINGLTDNEESLYSLIWKRTLCSQMKAAEYDVYQVALKGKDRVSGQYPIFTAKTESLRFKSWKIFGEIDKDDVTDDAENKKELTLPEIIVGQEFPGSGDVILKKTRAPKRYTQPALIEELKKMGIGRPSTYAAILDNITTRKYVEFTDKKCSYFRVTDVGHAIASVCGNNFSFCRMDFTAKIEELLDRVSQGKVSYINVVKPIYLNVTGEIKKI